MLIETGLDENSRVAEAVVGEGGGVGSGAGVDDRLVCGLFVCGVFSGTSREEGDRAEFDLYSR